MNNLLDGFAHPRFCKFCGKPVSVDGLAEATGLNKAYISRILNGKQAASEKSIGLLSKALEVDRLRVRQELNAKKA